MTRSRKARPPRRPESCPVWRRQMEATGAMSLITGKVTMSAPVAVTRRCGAPLFGEWIEKGTCRSCSEGWEVPDNRPATPDEIATAAAAERSAQ